MRFLVVVLALAAAVHADDDIISCDGVESVKDIKYREFTGNWVAVESVTFKDGHEFIPENDKRPEMCLWAKFSDSSDSGLTLKVTTHAPNAEVTSETSVSTSLNPEDRGRISFTSDKHDRSNWEVVVIDAKSDKHFAYMLCQPPNAEGKRLPKRLVLLARHESHSDHEVLTTDEEHTIERRVAGKLHIGGKGIKPVRFAHSCWKDVE